MAESWEWTEQDVLALITNGDEEDLHLEYKRKDSLDNIEKNKSEMSKDVSAFANSDGGTIVYGMEESGHLPVRLDGVDPTATTREWIEQLINSRIRSRIDGIRIHPIALSPPLVGTVYVVYIPASRRAPHMAWDYRHYKRFNFQAVPMEHYELEDVRRRQQGPLLTLDINHVFPIGIGRATVKFVVQNQSPTMALYSRILIKVEGMGLESKSEKWSTPQAYTRGVVLQLELAPPDRLPIWDGAPLALRDSITVSVRDDSTDSCLEWTITAPDMAPQCGIFWLGAINGAVSLVDDESLIKVLNERRAQQDISWPTK